MSKMDTKVFFERGDEFKDNPLHFAVHRISNMGTYAQVLTAQLKLDMGDIDGCKKKLEKIEKEMVEMIEFLREFAKEYDAFSEAGNVIIPKRTKYTIAIANADEFERGRGAQVLIVSNESPIVNDHIIIIAPNKENLTIGRIMSIDFLRNGNLVCGMFILSEGEFAKIIGKAPQFIVDGLASGFYQVGDKVKVKMRKSSKQVRYTDGEFSREYQEVDVPVLNRDGVVHCEE